MRRGRIQATLLLVLALSLVLIAENAVRGPAFDVGKPVDGHLILQVDLDVVRTEALEQLVDELRPTLRMNRIGYTGLGRNGDRVEFSLRDVEHVDAVLGLFSDDSAGVLVQRDGTDFRITLSVDRLNQARDNSRQRLLYFLRAYYERNDLNAIGLRAHGSECVLVPIAPLSALDNLPMGGPYRDAASIPSISIHEIDTESTPSTAELPAGSFLVLADRTVSSEMEGAYVLRKRVLLPSDSYLDASVEMEAAGPALIIRFDAVLPWPSWIPSSAIPKPDVALVYRDSRNGDEKIIAVGQFELRDLREAVIRGNFTVAHAEHTARLFELVHQAVHMNIVDFCSD